MLAMIFRDVENTQLRLTMTTVMGGQAGLSEGQWPALDQVPFSCQGCAT